MLGDYADMHYEAGDYRKAFAIIEEVLEYARQRSIRHRKLSTVLEPLAYEYLLAERLTESKECYEQLEAIGWSTDFKMLEGRLRYAEVMVGLGDFSKAIQILDQIDSTITPEDHISMATVLYLRSMCYRAGDKAEIADEFLRKANEHVVLDMREYRSAGVLQRYAVIQSEVGQWEQSESLMRRALEQAELGYPPLHPRIADRQFDLAELLLRRGAFDEARSLATQASEIRQVKLPENDVRIGRSVEQLRRIESARNEPLNEQP
ncbi:MAG: tetratricopeptide repeat protein [Pirellulaceae bacterium]